jgi:hypothetical protein
MKSMHNKVKKIYLININRISPYVYNRLLTAVSMLTSIQCNNALQAYPVVRCCDAQTGGLIFSGVCK